MMFYESNDESGKALMKSRVFWRKRAKNTATSFRSILTYLTPHLGQGSLPEGYKMTTYKVMLGLLWISSKCTTATKFIVKVDDNSIVDLVRLERTLDEVDMGGSSVDNIFCPYEMRGLPVWRHTEAKLQKYAKSYF